MTAVTFTPPTPCQHNSDWFVNSFTLVVYENFFFSSVRIFRQKGRQKNFLTENHYKTIYEAFRIELTSYRVLKGESHVLMCFEVRWGIRFNSGQNSFLAISPNTRMIMLPTSFWQKHNQWDMEP